MREKIVHMSDRSYRVMPNGEYRVIERKEWRNKSERRQVIKARRGDFYSFGIPKPKQ